MVQIVDKPSTREVVSKSGAQLAVEALVANGVDTIFGIPGVHTLALYDALRDSSIRHVLSRQEQGVGFMADGYARATGKPGVATVITGPGVTNIATPLGQAYTDSSPILVLTSNNERRYIDEMRGNLHDLKDQMGVTAAVTKWNKRVTAAADVPQVMAEAFHQLTTGRPQPVGVEFPIDVLDETTANVTRIERTDTVEAPPSSAIMAAAELVAQSKRVAIYCGGGSAQAAGAGTVLQLAERLNAPVLTTTMGKGAIPQHHRLSLGAAWAKGNQIDTLLRKADCMIVIGTKLGVQTTEDFQFPLPERVIRIDIDPHEMTLNATPTVSLLGAANLALSGLLDELEERDVQQSAWGTDEIADVRVTTEQSAWGADRRDHLDALRSAIPADGVLTGDMTMMAYVASTLYPVDRPRSFLFPMGYGTLGFAVPAAIGAKIGRPEAAVVAIVGDGGFQYTMSELGCAVQERLGLPIVIFNDSTYSAVKLAQLTERDGHYIAVDLVNPDFVKLADAYGIPGVRANSAEQLENEVRAAIGRDLPTIIDVPIPEWF